jgi:hypothetical protein
METPVIPDGATTFEIFRGPFRVRPAIVARRVHPIRSLYVRQFAVEYHESVICAMHMHKPDRGSGMLMLVAGKSVSSVADGAFRRSSSLRAEDLASDDARDARHSRVRDSCFYLDFSIDRFPSLGEGNAMATLVILRVDERSKGKLGIAQIAFSSSRRSLSLLSRHLRIGRVRKLFRNATRTIEKPRSKTLSSSFAPLRGNQPHGASRVRVADATISHAGGHVID